MIKIELQIVQTQNKKVAPWEFSNIENTSQMAPSIFFK